MIHRLGTNLRAGYVEALGPAGVAVASPHIALVGGYLLIYGLSMLTVFGGPAEDAPLVIVAVVLGFMGLVAGIAIAWRPAERFGDNIAAGWDRTVMVASALVVLGTVAMALYLVAIGEIPILMSESEQGRVDAAERGGGVLRVLTLFALPGCWLLVSQATRLRVPLLTAWTVACVVVTMLGQVATANRAPAFQLVAVSIGIVLLISTHGRLRPRSIFALAGVGVVLVLAVGLLGAVRRASEFPPGTPPRFELLTGQAIVSYVRVPVLNLGFTMDAVPERIGWRFGYTYVQPLLTALPGKQTTFDADLKVALGQVFPGGGTVPGLLGEAYANFGPPGWFFVPLALGAWVMWLSRKVAAVRTPESLALYGFAILHAAGASVGCLLVASPFPVIAYLALGAAAMASARASGGGSRAGHGIHELPDRSPVDTHGQHQVGHDAHDGEQHESRA